MVSETGQIKYEIEIDNVMGQTRQVDIFGAMHVTYVFSQKYVRHK